MTDATGIDESRAVGSAARGIGIFHVLLGVGAIAAPAVAGTAVAVVVGIMVLVGGLLGGWESIQRKDWGGGLIALLYILGGAALVSRPVLGVEMMTLIIGIWFFAIGVWRFLGAFMFGGGGMVLLLISGLANLMLGGLILAQWPLSGQWALGVLVGVELLFRGIMMINVGDAVKHAANEADAGTD